MSCTPRTLLVLDCRSHCQSTKIDTPAGFPLSKAVTLSTGSSGSSAWQAFCLRLVLRTRYLSTYCVKHISWRSS